MAKVNGVDMVSENNTTVSGRVINSRDFIASTTEVAYTSIAVEEKQTIRGSEFVGYAELYKSGAIVLANGGYIELGGV